MTMVFGLRSVRMSTSVSPPLTEASSGGMICPTCKAIAQPDSGKVELYLCQCPEPWTARLLPCGSRQFQDAVSPCKDCGQERCLVRCVCGEASRLSPLEGGTKLHCERCNRSWTARHNGDGSVTDPRCLPVLVTA